MDAMDEFTRIETHAPSETVMMRKSPSEILNG